MKRAVGIVVAALVSVIGAMIFWPGPGDRTPAPGIEGLPSAEEIVAGYVDFLGGAEAVAGVDSLRLSGTWTFVGEVALMRIQKSRAAGFRFDLLAADASIGIAQGSDGATSWQYLADPQGVHSLDGVLHQTFFEEWVDFDGPLIGYEMKGHSIELVGEENLDGVDSYHVTLHLESGRDQEYHFRKTDSSLLRKVTTHVNGEPGRSHRIYYYEEFMEAGDIRIPSYFEREDGGEHVWAFEINEVEVNVEIDERVFAKPEAKEINPTFLAATRL